MSVFLSYSSDDADCADALQAALAKADVKFWRDRVKLRPGDHLEGELRAAIERSKVFVVLLSAASSTSSWVQIELSIAVDLEASGRLRIVPVRLDNSPPPPPLDGRLLADLRRCELAEDVVRLVALIRRLDDALPPVGRSVDEFGSTFTDHGIEVARTDEGAFCMQIDVVSVDLDESYTVLSQFQFEGRLRCQDDHDDRDQIDRLLLACAAAFGNEAWRIRLRSGEVKHAIHTVVDGDDDFTLTARIRRIGAASTGELLLNVGALFGHICDSYGLRH